MRKRVYKTHLILFALCIFLVAAIYSIFIYKVKESINSIAFLDILNAPYHVNLGPVSNYLSAYYRINSDAISDKLNESYNANITAISDNIDATYKRNPSDTSGDLNAFYLINSSVISGKVNAPKRVNLGSVRSNLKAPFQTISGTNMNAPYQVKIKPGLFKLINSSVPTYPFIGHYVYENEMFCSSLTNLTLLVIVLSSTTNFNQRQILRKTWTKDYFYESFGTIKVLFLLGIIDNITVQKNIDEEFQLYGDIVQGSFIDSYYNLTHKSTMGFKWTTERCRNAKYVLKTDDDIVINMFKLFKNTFLNGSENKFHVYCIRQSTIVCRSPNSKWFVGQDHFKGWTRYPTYCGGSFVMILNEVIPFIYASILRTPFFWIEDVLLYGIVLNNIPRLIYKTIRPEEVELYDFYGAVQCLHRRKEQCPLFIFMTTSMYEVVKLWGTILAVYNT